MDKFKRYIIIAQFIIVFGMAIIIRGYSLSVDKYKHDIVAINTRHESSLNSLESHLKNLNDVNHIVNEQRGIEIEIEKKNNARIDKITQSLKVDECSNMLVSGDVIERLREHINELR